MNEQQLADLFSEQIDHLLAGEATQLPPEAGDLPELLEIVGQPTTQTHFQAHTAAQAAFQSQLAGWFGLAANGGAPMTILGLSKIWFISIVVAIVTVITGAGFIAMIATSIFVFARGPVAYVPAKTPAATASPVPSTPVTPPVTPTIVVSGTPGIPPAVGLPPLIFIGHFYVPRLCAGIYTTQSTLANIGNAPVDNAALAWEVVEGADLVDTVGFNSANLVSGVDNSAAAGTDPAAGAVASNPLVGAVDFRPISVEQNVKLDVKVKVKEDWWKHKGQTKIKIKLSVKNKLGLQPHPGPATHSQIITLVRQDAQWVTLTGIPHNYGPGRMLVGGHIVVINDCTGLPANWPPGSNVQIAGWLQPDGTFIAINIVVINVNIISGDFNSGVPLPGHDNDDGDDHDGGGGGHRGGGHGDDDHGHGGDDDD